MTSNDQGYFFLPELAHKGTDTDEVKAYKTGYLHSYFGVDAEYPLLGLSVAEAFSKGQQDGELDRQYVIKETGVDPHSW